MKDNEEILTQSEDELEEDLSELEEEDETEMKKSSPKIVDEKPAETNETYEGFMQPARLGIVNTVTGDVIEGFNPEKDEGVVQLGKAILNKLDRIAIASGI